MEAVEYEKWRDGIDYVGVGEAQVRRHSKRRLHAFVGLLELARAQKCSSKFITHENEQSDVGDEQECNDLLPRLVLHCVWRDTAQSKFLENISH